MQCGVDAGGRDGRDSAGTVKVLVCGSRDFNDHTLIASFLTGIQRRWYHEPPLVIIHGSARGADDSAKVWANQEGVRDGYTKVEPYQADWETHHPDWCDGDCSGSRKPRSYCSRAGYRRNQQMLDGGNPELVLAFVNKPLEESRGTCDMVTRAREAGVKVVVVESR